MPRVEVLSIEYCTPNPDARGIRGSGIDLEQMNVLVKLGCGHHFRFENARLMTHWLSTAEHQYESLRERFTVDCQQCGGCEVGLGPRSAAAARPPDVGVRLPDGRVFIPSGLKQDP